MHFASNEYPCLLQFSAEELEDNVADCGAYERNRKICLRNDVVKRKGEGLPLAIDAGKLPRE
jgi:hypothetical protein